MYYFAACIFLSAFLLFQVEPLIAKYILPWFGGSSAVWSTVMLFFQILLTGGYAYAAWIANQDHRREKVHILLLGFSVTLMLCLGFIWKSPITPGPSFKPQADAIPALQIFKVLLFSVGLPFFLLASNSPLIQVWFHRVFPQKTAYRLYALSNIGSLLALISYPVLIEPALPLTWQGRVWSLAYAVFAGLAAYGAIKVFRQKRSSITQVSAMSVETVPPLRGRDVALWIALAALASVLLLAVTSQITQEVASIPFLWVLPLIVYLLTFILAFSSERFYSRQVFIILFFPASILAFWALGRSSAVGIWVQIGIYSLVLFTACMVCHGELYRLRPHPSRLTTFYLMVSVGGAIGGIIINFIVPYIFKGYWELSLGLAACWVLYLLVTILTTTKTFNRRLFLGNFVIFVSMITFASIRSYQQIRLESKTELDMQRNFYGVIRIREKTFTAHIPIHLGSIGQDITSYDRFSLVHGITTHGLQFHDDNLKDLPTSYFGKNSGGGLAILNSPKRGEGMKVGVLGLGVGTLASYGQAGDTYRFYEINPLVISLAEGEGGYFSYLTSSPAKVEIIQGDARLSLENELARGQPQNYDVLAMDVFSSDSIPVHLLDEQAFDLYLKHLQPDGILAVHISNSHLDLKPVVWKLADHFGLARVLIDDTGDGVITYRSTWILLARDPALLQVPAIASAAESTEGYTSNIRLWTDDYNNLFQIFH